MLSKIHNFFVERLLRGIKLLLHHSKTLFTLLSQLFHFFFAALFEFLHALAHRRKRTLTLLTQGIEFLGMPGIDILSASSRLFELLILTFFCVLKLPSRFREPIFVSLAQLLELLSVILLKVGEPLFSRCESVITFLAHLSQILLEDCLGSLGFGKIGFQGGDFIVERVNRLRSDFTVQTIFCLHRFCEIFRSLGESYVAQSQLRLVEEHRPTNQRLTSLCRIKRRLVSLLFFRQFRLKFHDLFLEFLRIRRLPVVRIFLVVLYHSLEGFDSTVTCGESDHIFELARLRFLDLSLERTDEISAVAEETRLSRSESQLRDDDLPTQRCLT